MNKCRYFYNNEEVKLMYTHKNDSWIKLEDGTDLIVPFNEVKIKGKFEHLRDLPVDTKVLVKDSIKYKWLKRYLSHVSDDGNKVFCFDKGKTSFTSEDEDTVDWSFCEVYEE